MKDAIESRDRQLQGECLYVFAEIHRRSRSFEVYTFDNFYISEEETKEVLDYPIIKDKVHLPKTITIKTTE